MIRFKLKNICLFCRFLFLSPKFAPPLFLSVRDEEKGKLLDNALIERNFVDDGIHMTEPSFMKCVENIDEFKFPLSRMGNPRNIPARQYVHRSGSLFIRLLRDEKGLVILVGLENTKQIKTDKDIRNIAASVFQDVSAYVVSLNTPTVP